MICTACGQEMYIDDWDGWVWKCPMCDYVGRTATYEESDQQECANAEYLQGLLQNNSE